jgi:predicted glycosyltransferase
MLSLAPYMRTFAVCRLLCSEHTVDYVFAGRGIESRLNYPNFREIFLPPFALHLPERRLHSPESGLSSGEFFFKRASILKEALQPPYDCFVTELFPFSGLEFKDEVLMIIDYLQQFGRGCRIVCSLRDIMDPKIPAERLTTVELLLGLYDTILVHGDPTIMPLEKSCSYAGLVAHKIRYTGFIPNKADKNPILGTREKRFLISNGTGVFGDEFILTVAQALSKFPEYEAVFLLGPLSSQGLHLNMKALCARSDYAHLRVSEMVADYCGELEKSVLSIGLAGYSLIDVVCTKTPALVYPAGFPDQFLRAKVFAEKQYVKIIEPKDLFPRRIASMITERLSIPYPENEIDMEGAEHSRQILTSEFKKKSIDFERIL